VFYTFPAHLVSPILPEAHEQNGAVIAAVIRAAAAFATRGYEVFLDGIVGPWFLPVVAAELASTGIPVEYVILQVGRDEAVRRATSRPQPGDEVMVRHMHTEFQNLGEYAWSCPGSGGKEKWRILPVGEVHDQRAALQGGHRRNTPWARVSASQSERMSVSPSRWAN
jgi:hypothetical protein